jgi:hypothetical protein
MFEYGAFRSLTPHRSLLVSEISAAPRQITRSWVKAWSRPGLPRLARNLVGGEEADDGEGISFFAAMGSLIPAIKEN